jgi:DUF1680 family protein
VQITQTTRFPEESRAQLSIATDKPTSFALRIRQPGWSPSATIRINGREERIHRTPGQYIELSREWRNGDRVDIGLSMQLRFEPLPTATDIAALMYGPLVLAGRLGTAGLTPGADVIVNERQSGDMLNLPRELPIWRLDRAKLQDFVERDPTRPLTFRVRGVAEFPRLELIPYYGIAHERYNLYWKLA